MGLEESIWIWLRMIRTDDLSKRTCSMQNRKEDSMTQRDVILTICCTFFGWFLEQNQIRCGEQPQETINDSIKIPSMFLVPCESFLILMLKNHRKTIGKLWLNGIYGIYLLVGGDWNMFFCSIQLGMSLVSIDEVSVYFLFQRGRTTTTNQIAIDYP